jgi:ligand-binding sensor domain-containing protein
MSAIKRIDFSYNYAGIFTFSNNKINEVDSSDFLTLDPSLKRQKGIRNEHYWYNENLIIRYDESQEQLAYSWLVDNNDPLKSSQLKTDIFGNLWEASNDGINEFDGQSWKTYFNGNIFWAICFDNQKNLYASTMPEFDEPGIILKYDYEKWDTLVICSANAKWVPCMHFDNENNLWFGVLSRKAVAVESGDGLYKYDGNSVTSFNIYNSKLPSNSIIDIAIDSQNNKWIGMYSGGLAKLNSNKEFKIYDKNNTPMPFESIEHLVVDKSNNIWMAIQFYGLAKLKE